MCGVMFRMTPVSAYWIVLKTEFVGSRSRRWHMNPSESACCRLRVILACLLSVASSVGVESTVMLVLDGQSAQKHRYVL